MARYKVWAVSLCYNDFEVIGMSLRQYRATSSPQVETVHVLVDQHWPLGGDSRASKLRGLAESMGGLYLDPGANLGLARGFNWAVSQLPIPDNAMIVGYDPDSWPVDFGWDEAMCDLFVARPDVAWFSLWHPHAQRELLEENRGEDLGDGTVRAKSAVMNSVCGWRKKWFREVGGLHEVNEKYGGLESHTFPRLGNWKWIFLKNFREDYWPKPEILNGDYRTWKWATTHGGEKQIDFGDWLILKGKT